MARRRLLSSTSATGRPISNVVFMGMGEPLENYDGVVQAIHGLVDVSKFGMAPRSVTVSTVGIVGASSG